jgi:hypothetical protein
MFCHSGSMAEPPVMHLMSDILPKHGHILRPASSISRVSDSKLYNLFCQDFSVFRLWGMTS